jgi:hypothetical protein
LDHKVLDYPVEYPILVKALFRQEYKIIDGDWSIGGEQLQSDIAFTGMDDGGVGLGLIDGHFRRVGILLWHDFSST